MKSRIVIIASLLVVFGFLFYSTTGGSMGLLTGKRPKNLGVTDGKLKECHPKTLNCVCSQSSVEYAKIDPLKIPEKGLGAVKEVIQNFDGATIIEEKDNYIYAEFSTKFLGFVDDVEFYLDEKEQVIHVRSASRLGKSDFAANRKRIEKIRAEL